MTGLECESGLIFWTRLDLWRVPDHLLAAFIYSDRTEGPDIYWDGDAWWVTRFGEPLTDRQISTIKEMA